MRQCLIVDDSNSIRKVARRILQDYDFETREADSEKSGLAACGQDMPDCIVVDWRMPDGDGLEFLKRLRAMPGGDRPKVMYCTSENDRIKVAKALRLGADGHMMKPFDRESLVRAFSEAGLI
ncbi:response regulator [Propylenella binzhouense]|uniref:Response regulator n=1 Tax=Propylenella binzhouense TaxID=2555902 RepID=A0A964WUI2_9HYPH|nr:response regulator [Propylenella binzhouense]MYZ49053.1 response regulator [Propylenella binzhouense]